MEETSAALKELSTLNGNPFRVLQLWGLIYETDLQSVAILSTTGIGSYLKSLLWH